MQSPTNNHYTYIPPNDEGYYDEFNIVRAPPLFSAQSIVLIDPNDNPQIFNDDIKRKPTEDEAGQQKGTDHK